METVVLDHAGAELRGEVTGPAGGGPHPAVLVFPSAFGLGDVMRAVAGRLREAGYVALVADMYGGGLYTEDHERISEYFMPLISDPQVLRSRVAAWLETLTARADVDGDRVAAIGFCFGGQCVLELARSGAEVKAFVSYHGLLTTSTPAQVDAIKGQVCVFTGALDPHAPPADVAVLRDEFISAGARWHITEFGNSHHAFTDPGAATPETGRQYDPLADAVSWAGTLALLAMLLAPH